MATQSTPLARAVYQMQKSASPSTIVPSDTRWTPRLKSLTRPLIKNGRSCGAILPTGPGDFEGVLRSHTLSIDGTVRTSERLFVLRTGRNGGCDPRGGRRVFVLSNGSLGRLVLLMIPASRGVGMLEVRDTARKRTTTRQL